MGRLEGWLLLLLFLVLLVDWLLFRNMWYHWLRAQFGNWQTCSAVLICCNQDNNHNNNTTKRNITLVVPYIKGPSEKFKRLCKTKGIQVHFKGTNTLRTQLVNLKDKDPKTNKSGIIYHYKCPHINCPEAYIGESGRALGERVKEHLKAPSRIFHHSSSIGLRQLQYYTQGST